MTKAVNLVVVVIFLATGLNCNSPEQTTSADSAEDDFSTPPLELIRGNYERAPIAVSVLLERVEAVDSLLANDGRIGYLAFEANGRITQAYKTPDGFGTSITYRFSREYQQGWEEHLHDGVEMVAFLKPMPELPYYQVFDEFAEFRMTPNLRQMLDSLATQAP